MQSQREGGTPTCATWPWLFQSWRADTVTPAALQGRGDDTVLLDVRNRRECAIGRFDCAVTPPTTTFAQYPRWLEQNKEMLRDKKVILYCTGGIRCEKTAAWIRSETSAVSVGHLQGGIHRYLEEFGVDGVWKGKNFVFDQRQSVDGSGSSDVATDLGPELTVGRCEGPCGCRHDVFEPGAVCCVCREPVLICPECRAGLTTPTGSLHCADHSDLKDCYFSDLGAYGVDALAAQRLGLRRLLAAVAEGKQWKNRRGTLGNQIARVSAELDARAGRHRHGHAAATVAVPIGGGGCRSCGAPDCTGGCWGFFGRGRLKASATTTRVAAGPVAATEWWSLIISPDSTARPGESVDGAAGRPWHLRLHKTAKLEDSKTPRQRFQEDSNTRDRSSPREVVAEAPHRRPSGGKPAGGRPSRGQRQARQARRDVQMAEEEELRAPPHLHRNSSGLRSPPPTTRVIETVAKGRWVGKPILGTCAAHFRAYGGEELWRKRLLAGLLTLNGRPAGAAEVFEGGQTVRHTVHWHEAPVLVPAAIAFTRHRLTAAELLEHHDDGEDVQPGELWAVHKPATVPTHACGAYWLNSLTNLLEAQSALPARTLVPCHRLDRLTSGLVVCATSPAAANWARTRMEAKNEDGQPGLCRKTYLAKVHGAFPPTAAAAAVAWGGGGPAGAVWGSVVEGIRWRHTVHDFATCGWAVNPAAAASGDDCEEEDDALFEGGGGGSGLLSVECEMGMVDMDAKRRGPLATTAGGKPARSVFVVDGYDAVRCRSTPGDPGC